MARNQLGLVSLILVVDGEGRRPPKKTLTKLLQLLIRILKKKNRQNIRQCEQLYMF